MNQFGTGKDSLTNVRALFEGGHADEAMIILKDFLIDHQEDGDAWALLAEITQDPKERAFALEQTRRLGVSDQSVATAMAGSAGKRRSTEGTLQNALDLAKSGKKLQANRMAEGVLQYNQKMPAAWYVKGVSAADIREYQESLHMLLELAKTNPDAQPYFERLKEHGFEEKRKSRIAPIWLLAGGLGLFVVLLVALGSAVFGTWKPTATDGILEEIASEPEKTCEELIADAMAVSDQQCQLFGTNEVCYGNDSIDSDHLGNPDEFDGVGDVLGISKLNWLRASPLDLALQHWGVAVFRLTANMDDIPNVIPGQVVTFLVFGDTDIQNASGDMSAFYFSTGLGGIKCKNVDFNGLEINTPDGSGIVFSVNGAEVALQGDAVMSANPGGEMNISLVSGSGTVSANGKTSAILPGTYVSVPINENLESIGQPSDAQPMTGEQASVICLLYGLNCPGGTQIEIVTLTEAPVVTTEGPVITTEAPIVTTEAPVVTTEAPVVTTTVPPVSTTVPPVTTTVPPVTTTVPPVTTTVPPTNCSLYTLTSGAQAKFSLHNNSTSPVVLTSESLTWPASNGNWTTVEFGQNNVIGSPNAPPTSYTINFGAAASARTVPALGSVTIINNFLIEEANSGYSIDLTLNNGCTVSASK